MEFVAVFCFIHGHGPMRWREGLCRMATAGRSSIFWGIW